MAIKSAETDKSAGEGTPTSGEQFLCDTIGISIEGLDTLPGEIQRNFRLMRELDNLSENLKKEIEEESANYLKSVRSYSDEERPKQLRKVQNMYLRLRDYANQKVDLAKQVYEMVDKHIRRLDSEMEKDQSRKNSQLNDTLDLVKQDDTAANNRQRIKNQKRRKKDKVGGESSKKKKGRKVGQPDTGLDVPFITNYQGGPDVVDMPVDPNEPTYCLCRQVSYGEMIGCDNNDCTIEWFHFGCVGLATKPKGQWYCPKCDTKKKK